MVPRYAGEWRFRNAAESGVSEYSPPCLTEKPDHGQIVAEHARALFGRLDPRGDRAQGMVAFGDGREQIQVDGGAQRDGALVRLQRVENNPGRRGLRLRR